MFQTTSLQNNSLCVSRYPVSKVTSVGRRTDSYAGRIGATTGESLCACVRWYKDGEMGGWTDRHQTDAISLVHIT